MMKVKLIGKYGNIEEVIAMAGKLCYSPVGIEELEEGLTEDKIQSFIKRLMDMVQYQEHIIMEIIQNKIM